jgi:hypothetical protein
MTEGATRGNPGKRGDASQGGFADIEKPRPAQDTPVDPLLAPPAENETGPGRDDGLGQPGENDVPSDQPVPSGDPQTESDRTDLQ